MMAETDDTFTGKHICHACIGEGYLSAEIESSCESCVCAYCGEFAPCVSIKEIAERIKTAFDEHYTRTADGPDSWQERILADRESNYVWMRNGETVIEAIQNAAKINEEPAVDVLEILQDRYGDFESAKMGEEAEFDDDSHYTKKEPDDQSWHEEWNRFEHLLKTETRFFNRTAANLLAQVFGGIEKLKTIDGRPLVMAVGSNTPLDHIYRARVFQAESQLEEALARPDRHIGSPPHNVACAGRMNAYGISVFYGATNEQVAIAEARPPVGSRVVVARFVIIRSLQLLDLTALEYVHDMGSIFDSSLKRRLERAAFLRTLGRRMARAVMPDDAALEYLPTQAVADFLATMNEPRFDGIIFSSVQVKDGINVVLFHHAARVEPMVFPKGTKIKIHTGCSMEDGWEPGYLVHEERVPTTFSAAAPTDTDDYDKNLELHLTEPPRWNNDFRESALQIDEQSVAVHDVNWVKINTMSHAVKRN